MPGSIPRRPLIGPHFFDRLNLLQIVFIGKGRSANFLFELLRLFFVNMLLRLFHQIDGIAHPQNAVRHGRWD